MLGIADDKLITLRLQVPEDLLRGTAAVGEQIDAIIASFTVGNIL